MVQSLDTGNRVANLALNKVLVPWRNLLAAIENTPFEMMGALDDTLKHSRVQMEYRAAQDMLPLEGAFGLTMEVGPALDYAVNWLSTNQQLRSLATAPAFWFMGAGGVGGGVPGGAAAAPIVDSAPEVASSALQGRLLKADLAAQHIQEAERVGAGTLEERAAWGQVLNPARSGSGQKPDPTHAMATFVTKDELANAIVTPIVGRDGVRRTLVQAISRGLEGEQGIVEYIIDADGSITHQRFIEGGVIGAGPNSSLAPGL
jgi:hypothetical protein